MSNNANSNNKQKKKPQPKSQEPEDVTIDMEESQESILARFDIELTWCIEQLQLGLETQNPDSRQAKEASKLLKILLSSKAPMVKKRQVMRNSFGDYRKTMAEEDKQSAIGPRRLTMPQVTNLKVKRDMDLCPVGPGTVFSHVVQIGAATRERAKLANKTEDTRLAKIEKLIEKEHRFKNNVQNRVIERTTKLLRERQALLQLLSKEYKVDNFITMKTGFNSNQIETKHDARHYVIESRVFNSGFNVKSMRPAVIRKIRKLDPNEKYRSFKKKLLAESRKQNVEINKAMPNNVFYRMLHDRENWRNYNSPENGKWTPHELSENDVVNSDISENVEGHVASHAELLDEGKEDNAVNGDKERSIVLERRLPRLNNNAYSMTMRTLGPVYFQASVNTLANTEPE